MRLRALFFFGLVGLSASGSFLFGCESGEDPKPFSKFPAEEAYFRQVLGRVRQGTEGVEGALVQIDPSPGFAIDAVFPRSASTDAVGAYRLPYGPLQYDLSVRRDREVFVFRGVGVRYFEPPLGADGPVRGFKARVVPTTDPPPAPGNAVAFFVSGDNAAALIGDSSSLQASFRSFDTTITFHAVEYVAVDGLLNAVAEGRTDVRVRDGSAVSPIVMMKPITTKLEVSLAATPPPDYALASLEITMDMGVRGSTQAVKRTAPGVPLQIAVVPGATYYVRGRATKGSAVSDSGRLFLNPYDRTTTLDLPGPVSSEAPIDDTVVPATPTETFLDPGGALAARITAGSIEHVLTPVLGDGPIVHVATSARATMLPDVTRLGLPRPVGRYLWTMEHFALMPHIDNLSGINGRVAPPSWKSEPRVVILR